MVIHTETSGSGLDVVLIHGWGANHYYMQTLATHLSQRFKVTNIDLPGYGGSPWQAFKSIHDIAAFMVDDLPNDAVYIGWSFGGSLAAILAAHYPGKVRHFIGMGTTPKFVEAENWPAVPAPGFQALFNFAKPEELVSTFDEFIQNEFVDVTTKAGKDECKRLLNIVHNQSDNDITVFNAGIKLADAADLRPDYQKITCPTHLILGNEDECVPQITFPLIQALNHNICIHEIPNAKHIVFATHMEIVFPLIDDILQVYC